MANHNLDDLIGTTLGPYTILDELGHGAMSVVFRAIETVGKGGVRREVALKVLRPGLAGDRETVERFLDEASQLRELSHPNIVRVIDAGAERGVYYIAMELVKGRSLHSLMQPDQPMPFERRMRILTQLAAAIDCAHGLKKIHRDIKPSNVLIGQNDAVTLVDFGLIKALDRSGITMVGTKMGTPEYMSPEQAAGEKVHRPTDIYSLGIVAYQLMTGRVPFRAENSVVVLAMQVSATPAPPSRWNPAVTPAEQRAVLRALDKDPKRRWPTAGAFVAGLATVGGATEARPQNDEVPGTDGPIRNRRGVVPAWAIAAAVALLVIGAVFMLSRPQIPVVAIDPTQTVPTAVEISGGAGGVPDGSGGSDGIADGFVIDTDVPPLTTPQPLPTREFPPTAFPTDTGVSTVAPRPTDTRVPTVPPPTTAPPTLPTPTAVPPPPPTALPPPVEEVMIKIDGPTLNCDTSCTAIRWQASGFAYVHLFSEGTSPGDQLPAEGRQGDWCHLPPGGSARLILRAVRADGSSVDRVLEISRGACEGG